MRGINGDETYANDLRTAMSLGRARVPIEAGQQLLHYRLIEKIGKGGMGAVWKAVDTTLDRANIELTADGKAEVLELSTRREKR